MSATPFHTIAAQLHTLADELEGYADQAALGTLSYGPVEEPPADEHKAGAKK